MKLFHSITALLFPPKCVLCGNLLGKEETDLCHVCRIEAPVCSKPRKTIPFVAQWTVLWYYKDAVRDSLLRFKFCNRQSYALVYGKMLAMRISQELPEFDVLTWVPISRLRRFRRGYDQVELIAQTVGNELNMQPVPALRKIRHNRTQSRISSAAKRRANVLGVYEAADPTVIAGKRVLLLDDIITTGATISEASRVLLSAGAKEIICAAVATAGGQQNNSR